MKIYISKINKKNDKDILFYKYKSSKKIVALAIWAELMEPRYILNKASFLRAWKLFMDSELDIVVDEVFQYEILLDYLNFFDLSKLELFLEKIWSSRYSFVIAK
ncbi:hypothetical protein D8X55_00770 [Malacoplasma penetrans]|uniref:Uncharacterized protein n=1 Tax=Malacoplasma penetrans (strain HF-2) TaxID=272633 RepID=Q8EVY5_MALP2|nr:hypothetical protein [Malacoplasma penetrans]RXY97218.1 hypothetical protein D8X55_00770 [Malacoplasma penetrans]BAC44214.1 hypothetical protein [Malacoplasma penetrans HF-2]